MSEFDDEVYSTIFNALRHGVRRKMLRMLSEEPMSFPALSQKLGISSSHLTYHIDALGELISKNSAKYRLSVFGTAAVNTMNNVEDAPRSKLPGQNPYKLASAVLIIVLISISGFYYNLHNLSNVQGATLAEKDLEVEALASQIEGFSGLLQLYEVTAGKHTQNIASRYDLQYYYHIDRWNDPHPKYLLPMTEVEESILVFYAPYDNLNLRVYLYINNLPEDFYIPVTLQKGNALLNESAVVFRESEFLGVTYYVMGAPIIWSKNITGGGAYLDIEIKNRGWYTLSLTGPITVSGYGDVTATYMWGEREDWFDIDAIYVNGFCELVDGETPVFFAMETDYSQVGAVGWGMGNDMMPNTTSTS